MNEYNRMHHAFFEIAGEHNWGGWTDDYRGSGKPRGYMTDVPLTGLTVSVVEVRGDNREQDSYDDFMQGSQAPAHILFKVTFKEDGETRFYRKGGHYDSYGMDRWTGEFEEVNVVTKTVEVYEAVK